MQEQQNEFGCDRMSLTEQGGSLTGDMHCGDKVGARVPVTGALKYLGR